MKKVLIAFVLLLIFTLLISYSYQFSNGLSNSKWVVEGIIDNALVENNTISLEFTDNKIVGNGGVNSYSCSYKLGKTLTTSDCQSTEIASNNLLINDLESKYLSLLTKVKYYSINGNFLILLDNDHKSLILLHRNGE